LIGRRLVKNMALMRENVSMLEKSTCRDQRSVYLGTIINMYIHVQQSLSHFDEFLNDTPNMDQITRPIRDIFAMFTEN
jgi:hypothetical protein